MKLLFSAILMLSTIGLAAQQPPQPPGDDPISRYLIPPELVMTHSADLSLSDKQRATIKAEVQRTQSKFLDLQWDMQEASGKMAGLLQQTPIEEAKVLETADRIMSFEREIKRAHLAMLIRIRNALTADQIAKLEAFRKAR
jgi:Spy/CpxP family protein refolding chaperone